MKRFLKALPVVLVGGLALTGCSVTETPAASSSFAIEYSSHAEGDALGSAAENGGNVLGFQAANVAAQLNQLGLSGSTVSVDSSNSGTKQSADLKIDGITSDALNKTQAGAAQHIQSVFSQWQGGDTSKTEEAFFKDAQVQTYYQSLPGVPTALLLPTVTEENGEHKATFTPSMVASLAQHNVNVTVTLPGSATLEGTPAGVSVAGHEVSLDAAALKEGASFSVTYHDAAPMMTWWLSLVLWVLGIIVTVLLIVIALAPRRRD